MCIYFGTWFVKSLCLRYHRHTSKPVSLASRAGVSIAYYSCKCISHCMILIKRANKNHMISLMMIAVFRIERPLQIFSVRVFFFALFTFLFPLHSIQYLWRFFNIKICSYSWWQFFLSNNLDYEKFYEMFFFWFGQFVVLSFDGQKVINVLNVSIHTEWIE